MGMMIKKSVFVIFLILMQFSCQKKEVYLSFNHDFGFYKFYKKENFKIYYKSSLSQSFLNEFSNKTRQAILIYQNLNDRVRNSNGNQYYIAEVKTTCGIGCGRLGSPGIEIEKQKFDRIYQGYIKYKKFDSLVFYELGRNFWFYDKQLTCSNSNLDQGMRTGFAVFMRNICVQKLRIDADSINGYSYSDYFKELKSIFYAYSADPTLDIVKVFVEGHLPSLSLGYNVSQSNFFASLLFYLYEKPEFGDLWLSKVWSEVENQPKAKNEMDVLNNFFNACCKSTNKNLYSLFINELKWEIKNN
jgi:hypothetical protein